MIATARVWARWFEITAVERVRQLAELVESHHIRAADAIQIAAALLAGRAGGLACAGAGLTYPILWIDSSRAPR
jgi:hypothetical protein